MPSGISTETNGQEIGNRTGKRCQRLSRRHYAESVTKLVGEMVELGLVVKHMDAADRRAVTLTLTERGLDIRRVYVEEYHAHLSQLLGGLTVEQCETTVRTLTEA